MRPVSPSLPGAPEQIVAEEQHEYAPLPVATFLEPVLDADGARALDPQGRPRYRSRVRVSAWVPRTEELAKLAEVFAGTLAGSHIASREQLQHALAATFRQLPIYVALTDFGTGLTPHMVTVGPDGWMVGEG